MAEAEIPTAVSNIDIAGLCDRITQYAIEILNSQSANIGGLYLDPDMVRTASYLKRLEDLIQTSNKTPMDSPKSNNFVSCRLKAFPTPDALEAIENQDVKDIMRRLANLWLEAANSQSADLSSGILTADVTRFNLYINASRDVLNLAAGPIDLPENPGNQPIPSDRNGNDVNKRQQRF